MGGTRALKSASSDSTAVIGTKTKAERIAFYQKADIPPVDPLVECKSEQEDISSESKSGAKKRFTCIATVTQGQSKETYTLCKQEIPDSTSLHYLGKNAGRVINQDNIVTVWQSITFHNIKSAGHCGGTTTIKRSVHLYVYNTKTQAFNKLDLGVYCLETYSIEPFFSNSINKFILRKDTQISLIEISSDGCLSQVSLGDGIKVLLSPCERFVAVLKYDSSVSLYEFSDCLRLITTLDSTLHVERIAFMRDALFMVSLDRRIFKKALDYNSPLELLDSTKVDISPSRDTVCINEEGNLVVTGSGNIADPHPREFAFSNNEEYQLPIITSVIADELRMLSLDLCRLTAGYVGTLKLFTLPRQLPQFKFFYELDLASKENLLAIAKVLTEKEKSAFSHFLHCVDDGMEVGKSIDSALKKYGKVLPADGALNNLFAMREACIQFVSPRGLKCKELT